MSNNITSNAQAWAKNLRPFDVFLADDGKTWLVSTLSLPQHPVCACGENKEYAEAICTALNIFGRAGA